MKTPREIIEKLSVHCFVNPDTKKTSPLETAINQALSDLKEWVLGQRKNEGTNEIQEFINDSIENIARELTK